jgi:hypothetical protein
MPEPPGYLWGGIARQRDSTCGFGDGIRIRGATGRIPARSCARVSLPAAVQSNDRWYWMPTPLTTPVSARSVMLWVSAYSILSALLATVSPCS